MDLNLLKYYINEHQDTMLELSNVLGIHYNTLSLKLNGKREFTQSEIKAISERYQLTAVEIVKVFF